MADNTSSSDILFPEITPKKETGRADFVIPEPAKPTDPGLTGYQMTVEKYRPEASRQAAQASAFETYMPRTTQIPLVGPLYQRALSAGSAALGYGEGNTFAERERNLYAGRQAYEEELRKRAGAGAIPSQVAEGMAGIYATPFGGIAKPTQAIIEKGIEKVAPYIPGTAANILSKSAPTLGQMGEAGVVGGASSLAEVKPGETAADTAARAGVGTALGAASPIVARGVGAIAGPVARAFQDVFDPKAAVMRDLAAYAEKAKPSDLFTPAEMVARYQNGRPVNLADIAGAENILGKGLAKFGNNDPRIVAINQSLGDRLNESSRTIGYAVDDAFTNARGKPTAIDAFARRQISDDLATKTNKPAYDKAYSSPNAQSIWDDSFNELLNTEAGKKAYNWAVDYAALKKIPVSNPFVVANDGTIALAPGLSGANLQFLDLVKRGFKVPREELLRARDFDKAGALDERVNQFTNFLKSQVDEYGTALSGAGKFIRGNNAFEAGENFYDLMTRGAKGGELNKQMYNLFNKFTPEEKALYQEGVGSWIKENPTKAAALFKGGNPQSSAQRQLVEQVLGKQTFQEIDSAMRVARVTSLISAIKENPSILKQYPQAAGILSGLTTGSALYSAGPMIQYAAQHPGQAAMAAAAAGVGGLKAFGSSRKVNAFLDMASNMGDPQTAQSAMIALQSAAAKDSGLDRMLGKMENILSTALAQHHMGEPQIPGIGPTNVEQIRQNRASGGRITPASIGARLVAAAERAKKEINKSTEPLLQSDDESIAKALEIANKHI